MTISAEKWRYAIFYYSLCSYIILNKQIARAPIRMKPNVNMVSKQKYVYPNLFLFHQKSKTFQ